VAGLAKLPGLHTLALWDLPFEGVAAFAKARPFAALGGLRLPRAALEGEGVAALSRARLPNLSALSLPGCGLRNDELGTLTGSELFGRLRELSLSSNRLGDKGVAAIANSPAAATLRVLRLGDNNFGKGGLAAIARPGAFPALTTLDLDSSLKRKASAAEVTRFLQSELQMPRLRHLDLQMWPVDDGGARAIADNPTFANLTRLNLGCCQIGSKGAAALFASPHLQNLVELEMPYSKIGKAAEALLDPAVLPKLRRAWLDIPERLEQRIRAARKDLVV
jgi:Ran GTPase-activating protein (RanGAP) involved in mRNA processing and transport